MFKFFAAGEFQLNWYKQINFGGEGGGGLWAYDW